MENHRTDYLSARLDHTKLRGKSIGGRSKSRGRSKSPRYYLKKLCWKFGKPGHFKKNCKSKRVEKGKGLEHTSSIDNKSSIEDGRDVYLDSTSTQSENDAWLIDSGDSFYMTPHRSGSMSMKGIMGIFS